MNLLHTSEKPRSSVGASLASIPQQAAVVPFVRRPVLIPFPVQAGLGAGERACNLQLSFVSLR